MMQDICVWDYAGQPCVVVLTCQPSTTIIHARFSRLRHFSPLHPELCSRHVMTDDTDMTTDDTDMRTDEASPPAELMEYVDSNELEITQTRNDTSKNREQNRE